MRLAETRPAIHKRTRQAVDSARPSPATPPAPADGALRPSSVPGSCDLFETFAAAPCAATGCSADEADEPCAATGCSADEADEAEEADMSSRHLEIALGRGEAEAESQAWGR